MRPHWWWRPGWAPGRRLHAWHLTFGDQTVSHGQAALHRVVGAYQGPTWPSFPAWTWCRSSGYT